MEHSSKWNTHQNGTLIKMEPSSKWNTHQNGTLISKRNTHIIKRKHSSKWNTHQNGTLILKIANMYHGMRTLISGRMELSSSACPGLSRRALDPTLH